MIRKHLDIIHSPINYCSCSCFYLIFVLICIAGSDKNYVSHLTELSRLRQQPVDAVVRPTFIRKLCYKLPSDVTFTFMQTFDQNFCLLYWMAPCWQAVWGVIFKICVIFGVRFERRKVVKKSKPTRKLKHANSILEYFEYFCQMSSKSIFIISRYTVSKVARFLRHSVYTPCLKKTVPVLFCE